MRAAVLSLAAIALLSLAACGDATPPLLPRDTVVPVSVVTQYFPDVTEEASTGPNETSVGKPIASRSVVFLSADGKKKVTLSVDQYASAGDAAAAYQTAVLGSKAAPGFEPAAAPNLGE
jgi:predicted small lipoprotein YifL